MKVFYRHYQEESLNGGSTGAPFFHRQSGLLHYGEMPSEATSSIITDYNEFFQYVKDGKAQEFYIRKKFFSHKEVIKYTECWDIEETLKEKDFKNFKISDYYKEAHPSFTDIKNHLPVNEFVQWCNDNKTSINVTITKAKDKILVE